MINDVVWAFKSQKLFHPTLSFPFTSTSTHMLCRETLQKNQFKCVFQKGCFSYAKLHTQHHFITASRAHGHAIKSATLADTYTANTILTEYGKCRQLLSARKLFDEIPQRDTVSWNAMVAGYVNCGHHEMAWVLLKSMKAGGFWFDEYTFGSGLKSAACANCVGFGRMIHSFVVKTGFEGNVFAGSALLDMYAKCKRIDDAYSIFQLMPQRNLVSWNAMIAGYAQVGDCSGAFWHLNRMEDEGVLPDEATFASLLTVLGDPKYYGLTLQIHAKIIKHGRSSDTIAYNATITAYSDCGSIRDAERVFNSMEDARDLVSWNSMLAAFALHDLGYLAIKLFVNMQEVGIKQDMYTYTSVVSACFDQEQLCNGKSLHGLVIKSGFEHTVPVSNALIAMYLKSSDKLIDDAMKQFESMESKDGVSWNSILTGFSQNGLSEEALKFFGRMRSTHLGIDHYAFSAALRSCSDLAVLELGKQIHALVLKLGFELNDFVASSLIFMYSKCGVIEDSRKSFEETQKDSTIIWNSIIFGYAQHGQGKTALELFSQMQEMKVKPDHITFVGILSACSHIGLVEEGSKFLSSMESVYGIALRMEHYACGVDLFGRAGCLDKAKGLIDSMPFEPDAMVWKTLLGACRMYGDIELAGYIAQILLVLEPEEHCTYVLLSNIFASHGRWDEIAKIKRAMRDKGVRKVPGWSWIEVKNKVHAFNAGDRSHPQAIDIYERLGELMEEIGRLVYVAGKDIARDDLDYDKIDCE